MFRRRHVRLDSRACLDGDDRWAIFDGHAGPWTAEVLSGLLPLFLAPRLDAAEYFKRRYIPNDPIIINAIKTAFLQLDFTILDGGPLAHVVSGAAHAFSGSCALLALYDPTHSVLRLANVGDSRAVLGRWNGTKYVCEPMSVDHTGFNPDEVSNVNTLVNTRL